MMLMGFSYLASSMPMISLTGVAIGVGLMFAFLVFSISRNPSMTNHLISWSFMGFSLVEVSGFMGLVYSFLLLYALIHSWNFLINFIYYINEYLMYLLFMLMFNIILSIPLCNCKPKLSC